MTTKIERQVHFIAVQAYGPSDTTGANNSWNYNRAPDGYLFMLHSIEVSTDRYNNQNDGLVNLFDGHEYTHWNIWPGVQSQELLTRLECDAYVSYHITPLNMWECKEYTIGIRSTLSAEPFKACIIVWYYLKKASRMELMEYAIKHPKNQDMFKRILRGTTIEPSEANG